MSLDVICAGFGRTGTLSLKAALEALGHSPCWHIEDMFIGVGTPASHLDAWHRLSKGEPMDWAWLLKDFRAASDFPLCWYYRELMEVFPRAKVVLTVRDPRTWAASVQSLYNDAFLRHARAPRNQSGPGRAWVETMETLVWRRLGDVGDEDDLRGAYEDHVDAVRECVPAERLLVFSVREGWDPLCQFLGAPVPAAEFPHLNERAALGSAPSRR
jgi:hypothetical protein